LILGAILTLFWYPSWVLGILFAVVCVPLSTTIPRMLVLITEMIRKSAVISSPIFVLKGQHLLDAKKTVPIVVDPTTQQEFYFCARVPVQELDHIAYVTYYPKSRVIVDAVRIEVLTSDELILAVFFCQKKRIRKLLDSGFPVSGTDSSGRTALHWAYRNHLHNTVKRLLESGCDCEIRDALGFAPKELLHPTPAVQSQEVSLCAKPKEQR
jgi:hypothetical protein